MRLDPGNKVMALLCAFRGGSPFCTTKIGV